MLSLRPASSKKPLAKICEGEHMKRSLIIKIGCVALLLLGCGKNDEAAKSMDQIHKEQGIPVRLTTVEAGRFSQTLTYSAALGGSEESYGQSLLSEVVSSVKAKVGDRVSAGQVIVTFPPNTPAAQYEQASAGFSAAKQALERMQNLFAQGAISRQDLDNAETQYKLAEANLGASSGMINVRAPISGVVTGVSVNPGDRAYPGQSLFTIANPSAYKARLMIPDADARLVKTGMPATANWNGIELKGKVSKVSLALDPYTRAIPVEAVFPASGQKISFGSMAKIDLEIQSKENVIAVNREHIVSESGKSYVWVEAGNRAQKREVVLGQNSGMRFEIVSGLESGDMLIVEGIGQLTDKALVRVIE